MSYLTYLYRNTLSWATIILGGGFIAAGNYGMGTYDAAPWVLGFGIALLIANPLLYLWMKSNERNG